MKTLIVIIASTFAFPLYAQLTLSGTIRDKENNESLIGATIYFPDLFKGTSSDVHGAYKITNLPNGVFTLEVSFIGYQPQIYHLHISRDTVIHFSLSPDLKEMQEVIVTGMSHSTELKVSPVPAVITSRKQLLETPSTNLIDALTSKPGIAQISTGPAISKPVIRGLGANRVLVLYNGLRQEGQQWGDEHGIEIDEFSIDKVEIIKGPGSIAYGSDAMAGVINLLTPHATAEGQILGSINTGYQVNNKQYHLSGSTAGNIKGYNWRVRVTGKQAGNYQNSYDGKVFNSGFNEINWDAQAGINKKWGFSHLYVSSFNQHIGLVEGERDANGSFIRLIADSNGLPAEVTVSEAELQGYDIAIPKQRVRHFRMGTANMFFLKNSSISLKFDYQLNQREEFGDITAPAEQELYFKLNSYNYSIKYFLPEVNHWQTSTGINGMWQTNYNLGKEALIPEYTLFDIGAYLLTQKEYDKVMVSGGVRFDNRNINARQLIEDNNGVPEEKFAAFAKSFYNLSGSAGISYRPTTHWNFKVNISRGFRSPTLAELSSNGAHEGSFRYEYGNRNLKAETSLQTDLGIDFESAHTTLQVALFYNHIDNYIYLHKLQNSQGGDSIPDPTNGAIAFKYVQNTASLYGGEVGIDIHPHPLHWLHFENTFSTVWGRQVNQPDSMKYLPFIPAPKFKSELRAGLANKNHLFTANFIKLEWEHYFPQNRFFSAYETETATPAYSLLNAALGTTIKGKSGNTMAKVVFFATNLLDTAYQNHLSRLKYAPVNPATGRAGVFNMGRNFIIKLFIPLIFKEKPTLTDQ